MSATSDDPLVRHEKHGAVGLITLNRPRALNALSDALMDALNDALAAFARDDEVRAVVLTGGQRAFAAGADVAAMADASAVAMLGGSRLARWAGVKRFPKPLIAAVGGFSLGGGCELAMTCDIIVAADDARFGQPETNLGIIPGAGGTQRLTRAVGKSLAMEVVLGGRFLSAQEALAAGLCSRVVAREALVDEALRLAGEIASRPPVAVKLARTAVNQAFETSLEAGLEHERHSLYLAFASEDAHEGMHAFLEKRPPDWKGR